MKVFFKLSMLLLLVSMSFTSCSNKLTKEEIQQVQSAKAETVADYDKLKEVKAKKESTETKLANEVHKKGKKEYEKKKMRKKLGYTDNDDSDSTVIEDVSTEEKK